MRRTDAGAFAPRENVQHISHICFCLSLCEDVHTIMCTESEKSELSFDSNGLSSDQRGVMLRYASSPDVGSGPGQSSACEFAERGRQAERSC